MCEGERLELICTTNISILQWISSPLQNEQGRVQTFMRFITSPGVSQQASSLIVNSTSFNVSRVSSHNELPLVSRLGINPVNMGLNGTRVSCTEREMNYEITVMASTTIYVIGDILARKYYCNINYAINLIEAITANHPKINATVTGMKYRANNVTILLEWMPQKSVMYNVSISETAESKVATINFSNSTILSSAQITVLYNFHYNVSVKASCGQRSVSTVFDIYYGELFAFSILTVVFNTIGKNLCIIITAMCGYPLEKRINSVTVIGSINPALVGTSIMLQCPPEQTLIGPVSTTCMENGEWEPDPRNAVCNINKSKLCTVIYARN